MKGVAAMAREELMSLEYKKAPERKTPVSMRMPVSIVEKLDLLVELWKAQAVASEDDPTNVDRTHVCVEILRDAVDGAFDVFGGYPKDEAAKDKMLKAITEGTIAAPLKKK